jgi:hypothetical protein
MFCTATLVVAFASINGCGAGPEDWTVGEQQSAIDVTDPQALLVDLIQPYLKTYTGQGDGGITHVTYWTMPSDQVTLLPAEEQDKVAKIRANVIHAQAFMPTGEIAGIEVTGTLVRDTRSQFVVLKVPAGWNGKLVVGGTPGLRNEFANEVVVAPWVVEQGYAFVTGDKGLHGGGDDMYNGKHPTRHWGQMMIDLARWAGERLEAATGQKAARIYAVGLSNGGYQVRRALEIDHERVAKGEARLFDGGVDWAGAYWADARELDTDKDGKVTPAEFGEGIHLLSSIDRATVALGWAYDTPDGEDPFAWWPTQFADNPLYAFAKPPMKKAGFTKESSVFWGHYNTLYDAYKLFPGFEGFQGVGYYNLVSHVYRAELRGDDGVTAMAHSCYYDPASPGTPPVYGFLDQQPDWGWTEEAVKYGLENATTGEFSAPMLSVHGDRDALVGLEANSTSYSKAIKKHGDRTLHRLYVIENGSHVDHYADGNSDFNFDGVVDATDWAVADLVTPMQAYVMRSFAYLVDWAELGVQAPKSQTVVTDPVNDVVDPTLLSW